MRDSMQKVEYIRSLRDNARLLRIFRIYYITSFTFAFDTGNGFYLEKEKTQPTTSGWMEM